MQPSGGNLGLILTRALPSGTRKRQRHYGLASDAPPARCKVLVVFLISLYVFV